MLAIVCLKKLMTKTGQDGYESYLNGENNPGIAIVFISFLLFILFLYFFLFLSLFVWTACNFFFD